MPPSRTPHSISPVVRTRAGLAVRGAAYKCIRRCSRDVRTSIARERASRGRPSVAILSNDQCELYARARALERGCYVLSTSLSPSWRLSAALLQIGRSKRASSPMIAADCKGFRRLSKRNNQVQSQSHAVPFRCCAREQNTFMCVCVCCSPATQMCKQFSFECMVIRLHCSPRSRALLRWARKHTEK